MQDLSTQTKSQLEGLVFMSDHIKIRALWIALITLAALVTWALLGYPVHRDIPEFVRPEWVAPVGRFIAIGLLGIAGYLHWHSGKMRAELSFR